MTRIYCKKNTNFKSSDTLDFYMDINGISYYMFNQRFYLVVYDYFRQKLTLKQSLDYSRAGDYTAIRTVISKLPAYICYTCKTNGLDNPLEQKKRCNKSKFKRSAA